METIDPLPLWLDAIALVMLLFASMFFSSSETAVLALSKLRIKYLAALKNARAKRLEKILFEKKRFLSTMLIGNNIVNILISVLLTSVALRLFGTAGFGLAVAVATVLVLIFGETAPKSIALAFPEQLALFFSWLIQGVMTILFPFERFFFVITAKILPLFGIQNEATPVKVTQDELKDFFETRREQGLINAEEQQVLSKILQYEDLQVKDLMIPRTDIVVLHINTSFKEMMKLSKQRRVSRFPVYDKDIDDIKGFFYVKDLLFANDFLQEGMSFENFSISDYLRKALFVFEGLTVATAHDLLHANKQSIAVVIDEYGGVSGVISIRDINTEILGTLDDEYDISRPSERMTIPDSGLINNVLISGVYRLSDLNEDLSLNLTSDYNTTIGGFIMEKLDEMPKNGDSIFVEPYRFTVQKTEKNRIAEILISEMEGD